MTALDYIQEAQTYTRPGPGQDALYWAAQALNKDKPALACRHLGAALTRLHSRAALEAVAMAYALCRLKAEADG